MPGEYPILSVKQLALVTSIYLVYVAFFFAGLLLSGLLDFYLQYLDGGLLDGLFSPDLGKITSTRLLFHMG